MKKVLEEFARTKATEEREKNAFRSNSPSVSFISSFFFSFYSAASLFSLSSLEWMRGVEQYGLFLFFKAEVIDKYIIRQSKNKNTK